MFSCDPLIALLCITTFFKAFLQIKQILCLNSCTTHPTIDKKELKQTISYNKEKLYFSILKGIYSLIMDILIIRKRLFHYFFNYFTNDVLGMSVYFVSYFIIAEVLFIPFDLFFNFVIEEKYNYNKMTLILFFTDFLKNSFIFSIINFVFSAVLVTCINKFHYFFIYAFLFLVTFQIFIIVLYPIFILPLFNKFTDLEEGELKDQINKLISKINAFLMNKSTTDKNLTNKNLTKEDKQINDENLTKELDKNLTNEDKQINDKNLTKESGKNLTKESDKNLTNEEDKNISKEDKKRNEEKILSNKNEEEDFPYVKVKKILKMDGSKRSHHSNAYFIGLFKEKRIVMYDTLMDQLNNNEILGVLGHEFGHSAGNHLVKNLFLMFFIQLMILFTYSFTRNKNEIIIIDLIYFSYYFTGVNILLNYIQNFVSRKFEVEADDFAVKLGLGKELKDGLIKLHKDNKAPPVTDKWYSIYINSHPTLEERVEFIDSLLKKEE